MAAPRRNPAATAERQRSATHRVFPTQGGADKEPRAAARRAAATLGRRPQRPDGGQPRQGIQEASGAARRVDRRPARRSRRPARPERRRQDHLLLHHHRPDAAGLRLRSRSTATTSPTCRCTAARGSASATCRRRPRSSAASPSSRTSAPCSRCSNPTASTARGALDELLAEFSITHLRRTPALALSGGERRRVEIARALASRPQLHAARRAARRHRPDRGGDIRDLVSHLQATAASAC